MRMLTDSMEVFACEPRPELLGDRQENQAYCFANPGVEYAVFFPDGGSVTLDCSAVQGEVTVRWLDILQSAWQPEQRMQAGAVLPLAAPGPGFRAALVKGIA